VKLRIPAEKRKKSPLLSLALGRIAVSDNLGFTIGVAVIMVPLLSGQAKYKKALRGNAVD